MMMQPLLSTKWLLLTIRLSHPDLFGTISFNPTGPMWALNALATLSTEMYAASSMGRKLLGMMFSQAQFLDQRPSLTQLSALPRPSALCRPTIKTHLLRLQSRILIKKWLLIYLTGSISFELTPLRSFLSSQPLLSRTRLLTRTPFPQLNGQMLYQMLLRSIWTRNRSLELEMKLIFS